MTLRVLEDSDDESDDDDEVEDATAELERRAMAPAEAARPEVHAVAPGAGE